MNETEPTGRRAGLREPTRNNYFYGQLLGVQNFERETAYGIEQRRLLNRLVLGFGVVCGLPVELTGDGRSVVIGAGVAIDKHGREIIVARRTAPIPIPPEVVRSAAEKAKDGDDEA